MCKDQLCVKHAKFSSPFLSINHQCTKKHKARVFIILRPYQINLLLLGRPRREGRAGR